MQKSVGSTGTVSLVDIYGTLVASRIFVPSDLSQLDPKHLSLHRFRRHVDNGAMPLPIFAAIQCELSLNYFAQISDMALSCSAWDR